MKILVCGGRDFNDQAFLNSALDNLVKATGPPISCKGVLQHSTRPMYFFANRQ